ncbi:MAG: heparinase II/III family protein, partial [Candidatus Omnitrophica bacterium]|nr:heparinase II/III family protein [Candidatus Omnitrophota bacterium]
WTYPHYVSTPDGQNCLDMGDGSGNWGKNGKTSLLWIAQRLRDPMAWDRYLWSTGPEMYTEFPIEFYDYLWRPIDLQPESENSLPPSRLFEERGMAVFRSGWESEDLRLLYKAGPHTNHHHLDQGNFVLQYGGETLVDEGGYAKYYENKYYHSFYTQAVAHNTVLLGDYPESQDLADLRDDVKALDSYPRIIACTTGEVLDSLESELSSVYKGRLSSFRRSIIYPKSDYLVLFDDIEAHNEEQFDWLFHARGKESIRIDGTNVRIIQPNAQLRMEIVTPPDLNSRIRFHPHGDKSFVTLSTPEKLTEAQFLSVLIPSKSDNQSIRDDWKVERLNAEGWIGARVDRGKEVDFVGFRAKDEGGSDLEGFQTDAERFLATLGAEGEWTRIWVRGATRFEIDEHRGQSFRIRSETPITLSLGWNGGAISMEAKPEVLSNIK